MTGIFFVKQKTAYEMRISDWSSDVCSSDLGAGGGLSRLLAGKRRRRGGRRVAGVGRGSPGEALGAEWTDGIDRPAIGGTVDVAGADRDARRWCAGRARTTRAAGRSADTRWRWPAERKSTRLNSSH